MNAPSGKARVLTNPSKVADFWDWLTHRPQGYVACDIETGSSPGGHELDIFRPGFHVRMMQFGDADGGWAIPFQEWRGLVKGAFDFISESRTQHVWHNGFGYDAQALRQEGIIIDPTCMQDTQIWAGLGGFAGESRALKTLARRELGDFGAKTAIGADRLHTGMKNAGWTWTDIPMGWKPYPLYGVMDTMATARLYEKWEPWRKQFAYHHDMEIAVSVITNQMARTGMMVDGEYIAGKVIELLEEEAELEERCNAAGWGNPSSRADALRVLKAAGVLDETRLTDGGQVSIDKKQLRNVDHPLAALRLEYMKVQRMRKDYLEKILHMIGGEMSPQVIHPSIWSMAAKTGRMCLPTDHLLLTRRGPVAVADIRVGEDETLDESNHWVKVQAVHRYSNQEVVVRQNSRVKLEATNEHRWVVSSEKTGQRFVEPLTGIRRIIHLAPDAERFDFTSRTLHTKTEGEQFATLVGLLVSDGRVAEPGYGEGLHAAVYQTEGKFYNEFKEAIPPEAISYDRVTADTAMGPHHEIGLRARWLRPRLAAAGLEVPEDGSPLRMSESLIPWVLELSINEAAAFLQAVWLSDGSTAHPVNKQISCGSEHLRTALRIAGYRCGLRSHVTNDGIDGWATKDRLGIRFNNQRILNRGLVESTRRADVWCVSTETGTFTAWNDGPYLTGNSVSNPPLQQLPAGDTTARRAFIPDNEDHVLIGADFGQVELRSWAILNKDPILKDMFNQADATGDDFFVLMGRDLYNDPTFQKSDPRRSPIKNTCVPLDTKILTQRGWLAHDEVRVGDQTLGLNESTGLTEWTKIQKVMHYDSMPVIEMATKTWKVRSTPDHRWMTTQSQGRTDQQWMTTSQLEGREGSKRRLSLAASHDGQGYDITDTEASLLGWALSDGSIHVAPLDGSPAQGLRGQRQGVNMSIRQSKHTAVIDQLIKDLPCRVVASGGTYKVYTFEFEWARDLCRRVGLLTEDGARPSFSVLASGFSASQRAAALEAMHLADGIRFLYTSNEWSRDFYRAMVFMSGHVVRTHERHPDGKNWMRKVNYEIRSLADGVATQKMTWTKVGHQPVWCVRTSLGSWTMNQGGLDMITGNCYATIFSGGLKTISETANLPEAQVEPVLNKLKKRYPSFQDQGKSMVSKKDGVYEIWTPNGRRFKVREPKDIRVLPNWATQGWAATILKESAIGCKAAGLGDNLRLAVHDELILSVPRKDAKDAAHEVEEIMNSQIDPQQYGVKIYAKANIGESWADLK